MVVGLYKRRDAMLLPSAAKMKGAKTGVRNSGSQEFREGQSHTNKCFHTSKPVVVLCHFILLFFIMIT